MAGLDMHTNFDAIAKTTPIVTAVAYFQSTQNMEHGLLHRRPKKVIFFYLTRFLYEEVTSRPIYRTNQGRLYE
jgi:hypothetical protein